MTKCSWFNEHLIQKSLFKSYLKCKSKVGVVSSLFIFYLYCSQSQFLSLWIILYLMRLLTLIISAIFVFIAFSATTASYFTPYTKKFRFGQVSVALNSSIDTYDLATPYSSSLNTESIGLGISMVDYYQTVNGSSRIYYWLRQDIAGGSNSTHAVFRVYLGFPERTSRVRVRYLACPLAVFSTNFRIYTRSLSLGSSSALIYQDFAMGAPLNYTNPPSRVQINWATGINAASNFYLSVEFYSNAFFYVRHKFIISLRLTIVFINWGVISTSFIHIRSIPLPSVSVQSSLSPLTIWQDTTSSICGIESFAGVDTSNFFEFTLTISEKSFLTETTMMWSSSNWGYSQCFMVVDSFCLSTHPYYYRQDQLLCTDSCPSTQFLDYFCLPCPINCQSCSSSETCLICYSGFYLRSDSRCYSSCLDGSYPNSVTSTCDSCPQGCATCTSLLQCQSCYSSYFFKSVQSTYSSSKLCYKCLLGWGVTGGCTQTYGCTQVIYSTPDDSLGSCIRCSSQFVLNYTSCSCLEDNQIIVQNYCTSIFGCISMYNISGTLRCLFCDLTENFIYNSSSHSCDCQQGYYLSGKSCSEICGDGIVITAECDDGNTQDGDGCSHNCKVETFYRCTPNRNSTSLCQFVSQNIEVTLTKIGRVGWNNQAFFIFSFAPNILSDKFIKNNPFFSLSSTDSCLSGISWAYQNNQLIATASFNRDLQFQTILANFTFNPLYIFHDPIVFNFTVRSGNIKLNYYQSTQKAALFLQYFLIVAFAGLILAFVGSWVHKMVGVELIHTLQIIYYIHFVLKEYTLPLSSIQSLSLVGANDLYWQISSQNFKTKEEYQKVNFSVQGTEHTIMILSLPALLSALGFIACRIICCFVSNETKLFIIQLFMKFYHGFIFPVTVGFYLPFLLAKISLSLQSTGAQFYSYSIQVDCLLSLVVMGVTSLVVMHQFRYLFVSIESAQEKNLYLFRSAQKYYIPSYLLYWFVISILLWFQLQVECSFALISMLIIWVLMAIFLWKCSPYSFVLDTIGSIFNCALQIMFLLIVMLRNQEVISSFYETDLVFCLGIAVLCIISLLLSLSRILVQLYRKIKQFCTQQKGEMQQSFNSIAREESKMKEMMVVHLFKQTTKEQSLLGKSTQSPTRPIKNKQVDQNIEKQKKRIRQTFKKKKEVDRSRAVRQELEK